MKSSFLSVAEFCWIGPSLESCLNDVLAQVLECPCNWTVTRSCCVSSWTCLRSWRRMEALFGKHGVVSSSRRGSTLAKDLTSAIVTNPYIILQIRRDATPAEIRQSYRRLALFYHPGRRSGHNDDQERIRRLQMFEMLAACYETLLDKTSRQRCDELLKELEQAQRQRHLPSGDIRVGGRQVTRVVKQFRHNSGVALAQTEREATRVPGLISASSSASSASGSDDEAEAAPAPALATEEPAAAASKCSKKKPRRFDLFAFLGCGIDSLDDDEHLNSVLNNSTSTDDDGDIHYTEKETNRLFGGPLHLLYRARRFQPFHDPYVVFAKVFGSKISLGPPPEHHHPDAGEAWENTAPFLSALLSPQNRHHTPWSSGWHGESCKLPNGDVVLTTRRTVHNRVLTRTETIHRDAASGLKHSHVMVVAEAVAREAAEEQQPETPARFDLCLYYTKETVEPQSLTAAPPDEPSSWSCCGAWAT